MSGLRDDDAGAMDQYRAQVGIAAFADAQQPAFIAATVLARRKTQRRSHLPALLELRSIAYAGNQGRGDQWTDPAQLLQAFGHRVLVSDHPDLLVQFPQVILEVLQVFPQAV